jgi:hypothetical protein
MLTTPLTGAAAAARATSAATSAAAIGWIRASGARTSSPTTSDHLGELVELCGPNDRVVQPGVDDRLLLHDLGPHVAALGQPVGPDDRQRHVVADASRLRGRDKVRRRPGEEVHHRLVIERR